MYVFLRILHTYSTFIMQIRARTVGENLESYRYKMWPTSISQRIQLCTCDDKISSHMNRGTQYDGQWRPRQQDLQLCGFWSHFFHHNVTNCQRGNDIQFHLHEHAHQNIFSVTSRCVDEAPTNGKRRTSNSRAVYPRPIKGTPANIIIDKYATSGKIIHFPIPFE